MQSRAQTEACLFFQQGRMLRVQIDSILRGAVNSTSVGCLELDAMMKA